MKITSEQLKARIRNLSKAKNVETEIILCNFLFERFLERVSISDYKDNFILKGGMLITALVGIDARTTMDMDATIKGQTLSESEINTIIESILHIVIDDGISFVLKSIKEIRAGADYPGFRVSIEAAFGKICQIIKIDITTGDFITPSEIEYNFKLMFEDRTISIMAYNLETILAEKVEAIISRGITNTRMRDFYDIYILTNIQAFNSDIFKTALKKTAETRGTTEKMMDIDNVIQTIANNPTMISLWQSYQKEYVYATNVSWEMVIDALKRLAQKLR